MENIFSNLEVGDWVRGLVAAFVSGGSSAVVSGGVVAVQDPQHFKSGAAVIELMGTMFLVNAAMGMFLYLKQKPVPDLKTVTTTVQTTEKQAQAIVQTTVKEVHQEPIVPDPSKPVEPTKP